MRVQENIMYISGMKKHIVLPANQPIPRMNKDGDQFNIIFDEHAIKGIMDKFVNTYEAVDFGLFLNVETDERFDKDIPVGSLMAERGPCSYEFKIKSE